MKSEERFWTILNITILIAGNALVHEVYSQENNGDIFFFFFKMQVQVKEIPRHEKEMPFYYTCLLFISFARVADLIRH